MTDDTVQVPEASAPFSENPMVVLPLDQRENEIVTAVGRKGSGKSTLLRLSFVPFHPRVITLDQTGEGRETYPHAIEAYGLREVYDAIRELHANAEPGESGERRWHLIAVIDADDAPKLFAALAPPLSTRRPSLSAALGGVCIESGEVDVIAPVASTDRAITNAIARGRHYRLSLLFATQRPHQCSRMLSSQSDQVISFGMHEPRDLKWLADAGGKRFADTVRRLPKYWHTRYVAETGAIEVYDAQGKRRRSLPVPGELALDDDGGLG